MTETKKIDKFKINFQSDFNQDDDVISVKVTIDDELRKVLKSVCVDGEVSARLRCGCDDNGETIYDTHLRYKVKGVIMASLYSDYKDFVFTKDLVDNGTCAYKFPEYDARDRYIRGIKDTFRKLLETIDRAVMNETVTYNVTRGGE